VAPVVLGPGGQDARCKLAGALGLLVSAVAPSVRAAVLANSISVSGDSISRGFNANTGSCNFNATGSTLTCK